MVRKRGNFRRIRSIVSRTGPETPSVRFCRTKKSGWIARTRRSSSSRTRKEIIERLGQGCADQLVKAVIFALVLKGLLPLRHGLSVGLGDDAWRSLSEWKWYRRMACASDSGERERKHAMKG